MNPNIMLESYINHYKSIDSPGFAVLITGAWGTGKTYQINRIIPSNERYYISLFGLQSIEAVQSSIFMAMHPIKNKTRRMFSTLGDTGFEIAGLSVNLNGLTSGIANAIIRNDVKKDKIIVLDDLERCNLEPSVLMGVINLYIEHHGCRVIVLANIEKLDEKIKESNEKVFGKIIKVEPDLMNAFNSFLPNIAGDENLKRFKNAILEAFKESGCESLRVLKQTTNDCARLYNLLDRKHKDVKEAIDEIIYFFSCLNIAAKINSINKEDLLNRADVLNRAKFAAASDSDLSNKDIVVLQKKHKKKILGSSMLNDNTLSDMIFDGYYDRISIIDQINKSYYFMKTEDAAPWQILYNFDQLSDELVAKASKKVLQDITERSIDNIGVMLHMFHFYFLMSLNGEINISLDEVEKECKNYIDDLLASTRLLERDYRNSNIYEYSRSYAGCSYWRLPEFGEHIDRVKEYLAEKRELSLKNKYKEFAKKIFNYMHNDIELFNKAITIRFDGAGEYAVIDIFSSIKPVDFVSQWLSAPRENWHQISNSLSSRYSSGLLTDQLKNEQDWAKKVIAELKARALNYSGFERMRIERLSFDI